jgi:serine/threonine-protein kinase
MEYVHGCSLEQLLVALDRRDQRLSPEAAVAIAVQLCDGLHAAHETRGPGGERLGVVHRDVSPQNVLLAYTGHVKLIDFGIAEARGRGAGAGLEGGLAGKVRYMAPEQARRGAVDRRADVYALGVVLWEMLTLRPLFRGRDRSELMRAVLDPRIEPPGRLASGIPPALDHAVMRAIAPSPDDRPATANELRRALLASVPDALGFDALALAELLERTMHDVIAEQDRVLPERVVTELRSVPATGLDRTGVPAGTIPVQRTFATPARSAARPWVAAVIGVVAIAAVAIAVTAGTRTRRVERFGPMAAPAASAVIDAGATTHATPAADASVRSNPQLDAPALVASVDAGIDAAGALHARRRRRHTGHNVGLVNDVF